MTSSGARVLRKKIEYHLRSLRDIREELGTLLAIADEAAAIDTAALRETIADEIPRSPEDWLTTQDAADILKVHPATIRRWGANGTIPCIKSSGGIRLFPRVVVERLCAERTLATQTRR